MPIDWTQVIVMAFGSVSAITAFVVVFINRNASKDDRAFESMEKTVDRLENSVALLEEKVKRMEKELNTKNELIAVKDRSILSLEHELESTKKDKEYFKNKYEEKRIELENLKGMTDNE